MASTYSDLKIQLMATGENSGTWGEITNTNLGTAIEEAITGSADVAFSSVDVTLTLSNVNTTQPARNLRLNLTGTSGGNRNLIVPAIEKIYIINNGLANQVTVKNAAGTGIAVPAGKTMYVYNNGTNVVDAVTHLTSLTLASALPVGSGGTGATTSTGSGAVVLATSPTLVTPTLGTPSSGNLANCTFPTLNQSTTGNAATATALQTARTIGGVSFNGTANINLPGVNTTGNQNTTGSAATLTTARTINGVSFNGSANITITAAATNVNTRLASLGVGTTASGVAGEIRATNNITAYFSDDRLKTRLGGIENALEKVRSLEGFFYEPNDVAQALGYAKTREIGVSAQQVQKVLPEIVVPAPIDAAYWTVRYEKLIPLLIEAIKEIDGELQILKQKLKSN